jgi:hypothetical protein
MIDNTLRIGVFEVDPELQYVFVRLHDWEVYRRPIFCASPKMLKAPNLDTGLRKRCLSPFSLSLNRLCRGPGNAVSIGVLEDDWCKINL